QVGLHAATQDGQARAELDHARELAVVARCAPLLVVTILLATTRIAARRLQVTALLRADPNVRVRRRNGELTYALERAGSSNGSATRPQVAKPLADPHALNAGVGVRHVDQTIVPRVLPCPSNDRW